MNPSVEGLGARRAALQILDAIIRRGQTLDRVAARERGLAPADQALAIAIAGEALRRMPDIDALIDSATRKRLPDDSKARMVLRVALAQKIGLGTPDHAVVTTALPLIDGGPRRLVHGVLGTLLRRGVSASDSPRLPADVEQRWRAAWGDEVVQPARRQIARRPPLDLTFADASEAETYVAGHQGISLAPNHVRLESSLVTTLPDFESGRWWVQDLAASLPARLIPADAMEVLDLCAAPGGKTMQLAAAGHRVTSVDSSQRRLARLRENLNRTHLDATLVEADALRWSPGRTFDSILLDAPCSATGTFRRHPEVLYRARPTVVSGNAERQAQLLATAAQWLTPGGTLVYSVCSLEPQEGEAAIDAFLAEHSEFRLQRTASPLVGELGGGRPASAGQMTLLSATSADADIAPPPKPPHQGEGFFRILPGLLEAEGGLDGFFIAALVRRG
jgi:16S rRNA (cytosine967-C5)-methyltransferase